MDFPHTPKAVLRSAGRSPNAGGALPPAQPRHPPTGACPPGSLGHACARLIQSLNDGASFFHQRDLSSFPAYVLLNAAAGFSRFRFRAQESAAMARAIAHGTSIGFSAAPPSTARWEEGWELPVKEWRRRLGIQHPANDEAYGLQLAEG